MMTSRLSRCHQTTGLVAANEALFKRACCVSVMVLPKLHPPVRKGCMPIRLAPKVRMNPFKYSCDSSFCLGPTRQAVAGESGAVPPDDFKTCWRDCHTRKWGTWAARFRVAAENCVRL